ARIAGSSLALSGSRWTTTTKATPTWSGSASKKSCKARTPPADAPIAAMVRRGFRLLAEGTGGPGSWGMGRFSSATAYLRYRSFSSSRQLDGLCTEFLLRCDRGARGSLRKQTLPRGWGSVGIGAKLRADTGMPMETEALRQHLL